MRNEIILTWRRERKERGLVPIRDDFYDDVQIYLNHLESMASEDEDPLARQIFMKLYTRANYLINDLISLRISKIMNAALRDHEIPQKTPEAEKALYSNLSSTLLEHRRFLLGIRVEPQEATGEDGEIEVTYSLVQFLENELEVSVGVDLRTYGPFYKGTIAVIPTDNAHELLLRNKVKIFDVKQ